MVPHHRVEYTAADIRLFVVVDDQQFRSYGLSPDATELLSALAWWEVSTLLDQGLRLRTACDLTVAGTVAGELPDPGAARARLDAAVSAVAAELGAVTEVAWTGSKGGGKKAAPGTV